MSDSLPGRSKDVGAGKPLTPAEFRKRELERKALEAWIATQSYVKVKNALKLRSVEVAREMVKRGEERWMAEEADFLPRFKAMVRDDLLEMRNILRGNLVTEDGLPRLEVFDRLTKVGERMAKLLDLDMRPDVSSGGPSILVIRGGAGDAPWERVEVIEAGEVLDALSAPEGSEGA